LGLNGDIAGYWRMKRATEDRLTTIKRNDVDILALPTNSWRPSVCVITQRELTRNPLAILSTPTDTSTALITGTQVLGFGRGVSKWDFSVAQARLKPDDNKGMA